MAVHDSLGLKVFARAFRGLEGSYALIGGMACTVLMRQAELDFRATKDFDTVLLADGDLQNPRTRAESSKSEEVSFAHPGTRPRTPR